MCKFLAVSIFILLSSTAFSQWTTLTRPSGATVSSVSAPSPYVVWIACDSTKLFRSTDAGTTWSLRNSGLPTGNLYGISAIDSLNCWVGTVGGSIYRTSNGDRTDIAVFAVRKLFGRNKNVQSQLRNILR